MFVDIEVVLVRKEILSQNKQAQVSLRVVRPRQSLSLLLSGLTPWVLYV